MPVYSVFALLLALFCVIMAIGAWFTDAVFSACAFLVLAVAFGAIAWYNLTGAHQHAILKHQTVDTIVITRDLQGETVVVYSGSHDASCPGSLVSACSRLKPGDKVTLLYTTGSERTDKHYAVTAIETP